MMILIIMKAQNTVYGSCFWPVANIFRMPPALK
jgi:hypothetical protein